MLTRPLQDLDSFHLVVDAECAKQADESINTQPSGG